ncbi:hypothetical protein FRC12_019625 [Ceratobasidium sp. 428]|nr:hypothetical protein FRC09_005922 [Ceratobasidium sp. 395]KAG8783537.1 hypothetical protein FRC12_019625 [Ceratobasidium sp. 428]
MLSDYTGIAHDASSPSTADSPPLSASSTSLDSGSGRYQPGLILYPYRRSSTSSIPSPSLIPVCKGLGGDSKRSGRLFVDTKASLVNVSVANSPKPLSPTVMLDPLEPGKNEDKIRPNTKEILKLVEIPSEVVNAHSEPTVVVVRGSEDTAKLPHINKVPEPLSNPVTAVSNPLARTPIKESGFDDKTVPLDKAAHSCPNDLTVKKLKVIAKKHSAVSSLPIFERRPPSGDNSRVYMSKQALATIGRGFSMKPLRLGLKVKDTTKGSSAFKSGSAKPNEIKQTFTQYDLPETNAHSTSQTTSGSSSTANPGDVDPQSRPSMIESNNPSADDLPSIHLEATTRSDYSSQTIGGGFIVDGRSPLVKSTDSSPRDISDSFTLSDGGKSSPAPSVPIFKQRPSSGEWNRKDVFRRMSAMVQAPVIKPLGLKKASIELDLNQLGLDATRPASVQERLCRVNEGKCDLSQLNEAPTESNDIKPGQVKSSVTAAPDPPSITHDELVDLFDEVQGLYSASNAPKDPSSRRDDLIRDAFVLDGKVVPVSRSAGSRQDVSANHMFRTIEKNDEVPLKPAFKEWSPSWQDAFSKAMIIAGLAPIKPLRVKNKPKWLVKNPGEVKTSDTKTGGVDISKVKLGEVESGEARIDKVRSVKVESSIVQANIMEGLTATICEMVEVQPSDIQISPASPDTSPVKIGPVKVESVLGEHGYITGGANMSSPSGVPDLYVSAYEDCSQVVVKTQGRESRKEGLNRDFLHAYYTFRAPRPWPNQESRATEISSVLDPTQEAAVDPGAYSALIFDGQTDDNSTDLDEAQPNGSLTSAFDSDSDEDDDFDVHSDPFEYDLITWRSSQVPSDELLAGADDHDDGSDDSSDDYGTNPFKYDYHLDLPGNPNEIAPLTPVLGADSAVSSPESTPPTTPTSIDLPISLPASFGMTEKLVESPVPNEYWAWNDMDDMDDREGAIGTAL